MRKTVALCCLLILTSLLSVFASASFTDVPGDAYYAAAAERMAEKGILSGFGDGRFYGDQQLTRAQFAALACKLLGKVDEAAALAGATDFTDVPSSHWSSGYVNYTAANGIINGDGDGKFRPDDPVKYEEAIKVVICLIEPDNDIAIDPTDWSKNYIEAADNLGITANLTGTKGTPMFRSDIAVIADAAYTILEEISLEADDSTTTKKATTTKRDSDDDDDEPEETTTTKRSDDDDDDEPEVTTTAKRPGIVDNDSYDDDGSTTTTSVTNTEPEETTTEESTALDKSDAPYSPPPPLRDYELPEV